MQDVTWKTEEFGSSFNGNSYLGQASQVVLVVRNSPANAEDTRDLVSIPGLGRLPGVGKGNPFQCSCLGNPMDRGA